MTIRLAQNRSKAFTLMEVLIAALVVTILGLAAAGALYVVRVQDAKTRDRGIVTDFATHYLELLRGVPFASLKGGTPINGLYDGTQGAPAIVVPITNTWISIDTTNFQTFHPDLIWLTNRSPSLSVEIVTNTTPGGTGAKVVNLQVRWRAPMSVTSTQFFRASMLRVPDA